MTKADLLFIRACKSLNPHQRVQSVYRHYYRAKFEWKHISVILFNIIGNHYPIKAQKILEEMAPSNSWKYVDQDDPYIYWEHAAKLFISHLRLSEVSKIEGYIPPTMYRRKRNG